MKKLIYITTILLATAFFSCSNEENNDGDILVTATQESFNTVRSEALKEITQTKEYKGLQATDIIQFISEKGAKLTIPVGNLKDAKGNTITGGDIILKFIEIYNRGTMVVTNKPTLGRKFDGTLSPLFTGGEFYVEFTQNGEKLSLSGTYQLNVPTSLTNDKKPNDMIAWIGDIDDNGNLIWNQGNVEDEIMAGVVKVGEGEYYAFFSYFGWTNIDRFWDYEGEKTKLKVKVPKGYNSKNSAVYFAVAGEKNGIALLDAFEDGYFTEHYGYIPTGIDAHVIFVSEKDNKYLYTIKSFTSEAEQIIDLSSNKLKIATEQELVKKIKALP